jgi:hypothetical protein
MQTRSQANKSSQKNSNSKNKVVKNTTNHHKINKSNCKTRKTTKKTTKKSLKKTKKPIQKTKKKPTKKVKRVPQKINQTYKVFNGWSKVDYYLAQNDDIFIMISDETQKCVELKPLFLEIKGNKMIVNISSKESDWFHFGINIPSIPMFFHKKGHILMEMALFENESRNGPIKAWGSTTRPDIFIK